MDSLMQAVENRNLNQLKLLIDLGHDVNTVYFLYNNLLHVAVISNSIECAKILVDHGVDVNFVNIEEETPIILALKINNFYMVDYLIDVIIDDYVAESVLKKLYVNGESYLHIASEHNSTDCVNVLIKKGMDVNVKDKFGETPIFYAVRSERSESLQTARVLIKNAAELNIKGRKGRSLLHIAAAYGSINCARLFVEQGLDINYRNDMNITPLIEAIKNNASDVAKLLLDKGADIHVIDREGYTALDHAKQRENTELIVEIEKSLNTQK